MEQVDLTVIAPELFAANLVDLNLGDTVVNVEQIQAVWSAVEQAPDLQLNKLSMKSRDFPRKGFGDPPPPPSKIDKTPPGP